MNIHHLYRQQRLAMPLAEAWPFFSSPRNLEPMTPDYLHFRITGDVPAEIHPGLIITYRIAAVANIPMTWVTEISHVIPGQQFVDEQRLGPFRFWHHLHRFSPVEGGILMEDSVYYVMPGGIMGELLHRGFVRARLEHIFDFRQAWLNQRFNPSVSGGEVVA